MDDLIDRQKALNSDGKDMYTIDLTAEQVRVVCNALEDYFRLRMGQEFDFCNDMASLNCDLSPSNPKHGWLFDMYIARRDHLQELMRAFFRIAFEPTGYLKEKTEDMLIAEDIWDAIRCATGRSRFGTPLNVSSEPMPKVVKHEKDE